MRTFALKTVIVANMIIGVTIWAGGVIIGLGMLLIGGSSGGVFGGVSFMTGLSVIVSSLVLGAIPVACAQALELFVSMESKLSTIAHNVWIQTTKESI